MDSGLRPSKIKVILHTQFKENYILHLKKTVYNMYLTLEMAWPDVNDCCYIIGYTKCYSTKPKFKKCI